MSAPSPLIADPVAHLLSMAAALAAKYNFQFSPQCDTNLRDLLKSGLKSH